MNLIRIALSRKSQKGEVSKKGIGAPINAYQPLHPNLQLPDISLATYANLHYFGSPLASPLNHRLLQMQVPHEITPGAYACRYNM